MKGGKCQVFEGVNIVICDHWGMRPVAWTKYKNRIVRRLISMSIIALRGNENVW